MKVKKYIETAKVLFKAQIIYRFSTLLSMLATVTKIILAYILWSAIFQSVDTVAGFTLNGMIAYYILSSFIAQLDQSGGTSGQIADEIRHGSFSKYMVRPMSTFWYFGYQTIGVSAFLLSFNLIAAALWVVVFGVKLGLTANFITILAAVLIIVLGMLFMMQLNYFIGILAFKFMDVWMFNMIKDNLLHFVRGSLIPLSLLPVGILGVMKLFPFYYTVYLPAMLLSGRNEHEIVTALLVLGVWILLFVPINKLTYKSLRVIYDGVGI